jgi:hypothetical protein
LPTLFGIGAWGLVVGIAMVKSGLTAWQASGMTLLAFAGSAQLASLPLIVAHAPMWVIFATGLVVNLRFVIFSALLGPHFAHLPWKQRLFYGYISGDLTVALFLQRFPTAGAGARQAVLPEGPDVPELGVLADRFADRHLPRQHVPTEWGWASPARWRSCASWCRWSSTAPRLCGVVVAGAVSVRPRPAVQAGPAAGRGGRHAGRDGRRRKILEKRKARHG